MSTEQQPGPGEERPRAARKPYATPQLFNYGNVRALTTGGSGTMTENSGNMSITKMP